MFVDNLNDNGPGSLREACQSEGARIVIFRTGGTIVLNSPIVIRDPFITIAGQTAPGDGILIRNGSSNLEECFSIQGADVVIRGLRVRPGAHQNSGAFDAINFLNADRLIIDHCSFSWATDELLSDRDSRDVTVQSCIISEALNCSTHPKGCHGKGFRMGGDGRRSDRISVILNLFSQNDDRNPNNAGAGDVEILNNVIYNYGWGVLVKDLLGPTSTLIMGNYFKVGTDARSRGYEIDNPANIIGNIEFYLNGNVEDTYGDFSSVDVIEQLLPYEVSSPPFQPGMAVLNVYDAYDQVLESVGAIVPHRDPVDLRVINDVINTTGTWIDHQNDVGGWPDMQQGSPPPDSDNDGMPNDWEIANGLNPNNPDDANEDRDGDGYTNIEEYINSFFEEINPPTTPPPPVLSSPADHETEVSLNPTMDWESSTGASTYRLQVATTPGFSNLVFDQAGISATSFQVTGLSEETEYDWRVNAENGAGTSDWSGVWSFRTTSSFVQCGDILQFQSVCQPGGTIRARVRMANTSFTGETLELTVDGNPYTFTIDDNGTGFFTQGGFSSGNHTVELTRPAGCFSPTNVSCSSSGTEWGNEWDLIGWGIPTATALLENFPNPFNPSTTIRYTLSEDAQVTLRIFNSLGQLVNTLVDNAMPAGYHQAVWDGRDDAGRAVASGIYVYRMTARHTEGQRPDPSGGQAKDFIETKKLLLLK